LSFGSENQRFPPVARHVFGQGRRPYRTHDFHGWIREGNQKKATHVFLLMISPIGLGRGTAAYPFSLSERWW
jgi:hypothetical protein